MTNERRSESLFDTKFVSDKPRCSESEDTNEQSVAHLVDHLMEPGLVREGGSALVENGQSSLESLVIGSQMVDRIVESADPSTNDVHELLPLQKDVSNTLITHRFLVSKREAGTIIGKEGSCITSIRMGCDVKAGVSELVRGCVDRILTISGSVENVGRAVGRLAQVLVDTAAFSQLDFAPSGGTSVMGVTRIRLLIPNTQMGALIGKRGIRIRALQQYHSVKMVASKDPLANSTERVVEVQGTPLAIESAAVTISKCLLEDFMLPAADTIYYVSAPPAGYGGAARATTGDSFLNSDSLGPTSTETVYFPGELVGAIIGKRGVRIQEIRKLSGCAISIDSANTTGGERRFVLTGPVRNVDRALAMLTGLVEREKSRTKEH
ncbi:RNA binding protein [Komagataella phaffii CBS 7435]|uniref:RNA binding protein with similarity to hnRNP-K that localizes to the cytoplasm and subtelomeric DNA n=2 Tax=Komagataella phaffii TaxID=460519 RepID=C4QXA3_KOMPG|nr:RNA binding protein with similarity to hnRNP-K that localizes to the cytoplasm and subtelomeric DNA [Komagataella phaffii GS115]AOA60479.1 GQ67_02143T0 [Komagataella phaffii]CAH2446686.1 RNA binding protein [Komagataella phaffii CBS 7435]AOA66387.1 GQ68_02158T0 [Komagataella phaffii GS115]CAY67876.1 RNA binding protein with similarity to hnRNP-K that localizes to the cytoplasm and subtelomeric DNA [Komagataella phaffii GS115]CCA36958.1 RNA binding protein [Komagataella phaffii CBS 7435]